MQLWTVVAELLSLLFGSKFDVLCFDSVSWSVQIIPVILLCNITSSSVSSWWIMWSSHLCFDHSIMSLIHLAFLTLGNVLNLQTSAFQLFFLFFSNLYSHISLLFKVLPGFHFLTSLFVNCQQIRVYTWMCVCVCLSAIARSDKRAEWKDEGRNDWYELLMYIASLTCLSSAINRAVPLTCEGIYRKILKNWRCQKCWSSLLLSLMALSLYVTVHFELNIRSSCCLYIGLFSSLFSDWWQKVTSLAQVAK